MRIVHPPRRLEARLAGLALLNPRAGELAGLDILEDRPHLLFGLFGDDPRARDIFAEFRGIGDRVIHIGYAALINEVDDELHLMQALEICHLRRVARLDQRLVA